jgi:hypothetical protein
MSYSDQYMGQMGIPLPLQPMARQGWQAATGSGDKKHSPKPPDYTGAAEKTAASDQAAVNSQTQQNRPDQQNAFGASSTWTTGPDGKPMQTSSFGSGGLGQAANGIMGQMGSAYGTPFKFDGPGVMSGDAARDQAISGAYNQATSRLDPQWDKRLQAERSQLMNQGLDPGSQAFQEQMDSFGRQRNDAYGSAMNSAIGQGTAAGDSMFRNSLAAHNSAYGEQLGQYSMPMQMAQALRGFTDQSGFMGAGRAGPTNYSGAAQNQYTADYNQWNGNNAAQGKAFGGAMDLLGSIVGMFTGLPLGNLGGGGGGPEQFQGFDQSPTPY